ncbi:MAG: hypothetical protein KF753_04930 [Caldilineaceae bacterium]|nr:hypothetical protein [Caldilineaceae bacterium]
MLIDTRLAQISITEGEDIITALHTATAELCDAIESDVTIRRMLKEAEADLSAAESEIVAEANIEAQNKEGPLAGIATTSKAYAYALENLLSNYHTTNSNKVAIRRLQTDADNASIAREQAQVKFSAVKHAADLKAAIIRAIAL